MTTLNKEAAENAQAANVKCATDITGFGLAGHLYNIARASNVSIEIDAMALPVLPGVERLVALGSVTAGGSKNREFLGKALNFTDSPKGLHHVVLDPQTSGGLATFSKTPVAEAVRIGRAVAGPPRIVVRFSMNRPSVPKS